MSDRIDPQNIFGRIKALEENINRDQVPPGLKSGGGNGTSGGMDLLAYRVDQFEKRADASEARLVRIDDKLTNVQITLAGLATKDTIRNWGLALAAIVIATSLSVGAIMLQSSGNQLSAFQAGLSAIQAVTAAAQVGKP